MIITIVADVLGEENNGTTITAKRLIENLRKRGNTVRVVCPTANGQEGYYPVGKKSFFPFNWYLKRNGVELAKINYRVLFRAIKGSDVVHIMVPFPLGKAAEKVCMQLHVPFTSACHCQAQNITAHFGLMKYEALNRTIYHFLYDYFYKNVKIVHCPSQFIANEVKDNGFDMDLRVISNGVSYEYKRVPSEKPQEFKDKYCILFIGRYSNEKRHDILIDAVAKSKYADKIQLIFAGDGPIKKRIIRRVKSRKLKNAPVMKFYSVEDLVKVICYCDLYVHPADYEIEAISCLEAITCGLVPIISDSKKSATNHFALHNENLFKAGDSTDLSRKIDFMIEHPEFVEKESGEYMEYAKRYNIDSCVTEMEKMFKDASNTCGEKRQCE